MLSTLANKFSSLARFQNRVAIVTGGTSGIGLAITEALISEGCKVAVSTLPNDANKIQKKFGPDAVLEFAGDM